ncbi:NADP-dependent malic enzyme [Carboxylicivirga sediminis]|uniref:NADP-dependent malic enzyme n=1 Tax=Carboxylicivirga sediminis TaxID=2006564 RepID=A0A941F048_9BACT|nr:NADP-dependent malic enzyme [Carboxylicivirga sediminis]MBR8533948.1 NADP-dependent malic enzyme [Carboxylicivirga sediminis]
MSTTKQDALQYHENGRPGKIEVIPTKPYSSQLDLSLAYSPGVAEPCKEIEQNPDDAYRYTAKGNLVGVISNGTAVLGLGDIGAIAGKPVMEGKGLLFKVFADVDVFDIEVDEKNIDDMVKVIKAIAPTFGGINLEDIKAPECFEIETRLQKELNIPVFHDDQHGTAIISAAGLLNALEITGKNIENIKVVVNGAGASAIMCSKLYISLGVKRENVWMLDSKGLMTKKRSDLNKYKIEFAQDSELTKLEEVIKGADMFLGLSKGNILNKSMVQSMADNPIVFALANPVPEISYEEAISARPDVIVATGRSDYPNQVNNVLGFPFIFRGALDVRAKAINEEMKQAAVYALAELAKKDVPDKVNAAYKSQNLIFGKEYIIPKPLDPRLITEVAPAVAKAAMETGVARLDIVDWEQYKIDLMKRMGIYNKLIRDIRTRAKSDLKRLVFSDADNFKVLKAVEVVRSQSIAKPILLGDKQKIEEIASENNLNILDLEIIDNKAPEQANKRKEYADILYQKRQRKGLNMEGALYQMLDRNYYGIMMVETGDADGFLGGFSNKYAETIRPALQIAGTNNTLNHIAGMYIVMTKKGPYFFADTTVNYEPTVRSLADTTLLTVNEVRKFNIEPVVAMVSYSNFGSTRKGSPLRVREAVGYLHENYPNLLVDGEMQANYAFNAELRASRFPFSKLGDREVNTVIFPSLSSGNIAYKMMNELGQAEIIGPILLGIRKPIHVLQQQCSVREIVDMAAITAVDAQTKEDKIIEL